MTGACEAGVGSEAAEGAGGGFGSPQSRPRCRHCGPGLTAKPCTAADRRGGCCKAVRGWPTRQRRACRCFCCSLFWVWASSPCFARFVVMGLDSAAAAGGSAGGGGGTGATVTLRCAGAGTPPLSAHRGAAMHAHSLSRGLVAERLCAPPAAVSWWRRRRHTSGRWRHPRYVRASFGGHLVPT